MSTTRRRARRWRRSGRRCRAALRRARPEQRRADVLGRRRRGRRHGVPDAERRQRRLARTCRRAPRPDPPARAGRRRAPRRAEIRARSSSGTGMRLRCDQHQRVAEQIHARRGADQAPLGEIVHPVQIGRDEQIGRRAVLDLPGERRAGGVGHAHPQPGRPLGRRDQRRRARSGASRREHEARRRWGPVSGPPQPRRRPRGTRPGRSGAAAARIDLNRLPIPAILA